MALLLDLWWVLSPIFVMDTARPPLRAGALLLEGGIQYTNRDALIFTLNGVSNYPAFPPFAHFVDLSTGLCCSTWLLVMTINTEPCDVPHDQHRNALILGILYLAFQAFPIIFEQGHGFNVQTSGLTFLGIGIGMLLALASQPYWNRYVTLPQVLRIELTDVCGCTGSTHRSPSFIMAIPHRKSDSSWVCPVASLFH